MWLRGPEMKALGTDDPRMIGGYRLRAQLGTGGMGRVYLGLSPGGRAVAIKVVHPDLARDSEFLRRFGQEVAAARAVSGIYTAPVVASGLAEHPPWLATAFVPGPSLDQVVSEHGPLPEAALWSLTFVSTTGNDANEATGCSAVANCRTFAAALAATSPGGEIVVVNSGGYGPVTISESIVISAVDVASISVTTSGANGITINTPGNVTLSGLALHGEATGNDGILVQRVGFLRLYNVLIENFLNDGVNLAVGGDR